MNKDRGIVYVCWGNAVENELQQSITSAERLGLPVHVIRLDANCYHAAKTCMYDRSPFETTLFLDTDTVVLDEMSYGFELAEQHALAIGLEPACYADRWPINDRQIVEYNTGVIFFRKCETLRNLFYKWEQNAALYPYSDQSSFAKTVVECGFNPAVLPPNYNYRGFGMGPTPFFGPIKLWHSREEVPDNVYEWNRRRPYRFGEISRLNGRFMIHDHGNPPIYVKEEIYKCLTRISRILHSWLRGKLRRS